jgi:hypothetical protein
MVSLPMSEDKHQAEGALIKDLFFRSHVVELNPKEPFVSDYNEPIWPEYDGF